MKIALVAIGDIHTRIKGGDGSEKAKDYNIMFARKDLLFGAMIDMLQSVDEYGFIFVGDIAFAGEADEYILFEEWRREAHNRIEFGINKSPFMQVFVPGNHDCTIAAAESDYRKLMIDKVMETQGADNQWVKRTISVQDNFFEYISKEKLSLDQKIYRHERYSVQGAKISVHLMNTSWLSERRDSQGNLIVPQHLMTGQIDDADFSIAVMHHPFNWLDSSIYKATQAYTASVSDIIITGHEHVIDNRIVQSNGKLHTQFENGALQGESIQNPSEFQVIFYDTTSKTISVKKASVANEEVVIEEILSDSISKLSNRQRIKSKPKMSLYENLSSDRFDNTILPVKISELYIHVPLKELGSTSPDERKNYNDARTVIEQSGRIIVSGGHLSGKTTLVKHLARNLVDEGFLVVYIDLNSKKFESRESFAKAIDDYILTNYDISLPVAWGFTKAQKVIVIDNFKLFGMNKKKIEDFVEFIGDKFGKVCVATSEDLLDLSITSKKHGFDIFRDYTKYAIEPLGYQERQQLVESWHASLISDELGHNATNIRKSRRILDEIVSTNPFPAYPIFILSVLKNITSNGEIDQSPTLPKIYDSLVNIELVKISSSVVDYPTLVSILSRIAGKMFDDKVDEISLEAAKKRFEVWPGGLGTAE